MDLTMHRTSLLVIDPFPSISYTSKAHRSFSSKVPRVVMDNEQMNSLKSENKKAIPQTKIQE